MLTKKTLTLDDYQRAAKRTAIYPHQGENLIYTTVGLAGEVGEFCNKVKKLMRSYELQQGKNIDDYSGDTGSTRAIKLIQSLEGELGGILWYLSQCCTELGIPFNQCGLNNLNELSNRVKKDEIEGEGDDRGQG